MTQLTGLINFQTYIITEVILLSTIVSKKKKGLPISDIILSKSGERVRGTKRSTTSAEADLTKISAPPPKKYVITRNCGRLQY